MKNKSYIPIAVTGFVVAIAMIICLKSNRGIPSIGEASNTSIPNFSQISSETTVEIQQEAEKKQAEREYIELVHEYNSSIESYNLEVKKIILFLERIEQFNILTVQEPLVEDDIIEEDFEQFWSSGADFTELNQKIEAEKNKADALHHNYYEICQMAYRGMIEEFNTLALEYDSLIKRTSIDYIKGLPYNIPTKSSLPYDVYTEDFSEEELISAISSISNDIVNLLPSYIIVSQITAPTEQWVMERLKNVPSITGRQAVNADNDPNKMLGQEDGYTSCVYFTIDKIGYNEVKGENIVEKGTDAGGAVEVYPTLESALQRCDYLSGFDNTLLYSGSYVIIGTMVVRTSYKLTNEEQIELTNSVVEALTAII